MNKGTITATSSTLTLDTGASVIVNTGGLRGDGGNLVINSPLITGALVTSSAGGTVTFRSSVTNSGGLQFNAGGKVVLDGGILAGTGFMSTNASTSLEVTTNGTIDGTSQTVQLDGATGVDHGATLTLKGLLANKGTLSLDGNAGFGDRANLAVSGAVTLQGGGTVLLHDLYNGGTYQSAGAAAITGASATDVLTNVDNTISGYGQIGQGKMSLVNKGTITATSSTLTLDTGTSPIDNSGLLLAGGGTLAIRSNVGNSGQIRADTGSTVTVGSLIRNNGSVTAADGGTVVLDGGTLTGSGTFGSSALGKIEVGQGGGYIIQAFSQTASLAGSLVVDHGGRLVLSGTIRNTGAASLDGNAGYGDRANLAVLGAVTLQGGGTVLLHDLYNGGTYQSAGAAAITGTSATSVLDNVDNTISGYGQIGQGAMSLVNEAAGTIKATASTLTLDAGTGSINNKGILLADGGALTISSAVANTGLIEARAGTVTLAKAATGNLQVDTGGTLVLQGGAVAGTTIAFTGTTGTLKFAGPASAPVNAAITGFVDGDTLDLAGLSATGSYNGGVLSLQSGGTALGSLVFAGAAATDVFTTSDDGQGGTRITRSTQTPPPPAPLTPAPDHTATLTTGVTAVTNATLSGLSVLLAATAGGSPTLQLQDSTIAPDATVLGLATGGGIATLAVAGRLSTMGTVTLGNAATANGVGGYAINLGNGANGQAGLFYNGGTINLVGASPLIAAVGALRAGVQNDGLVEIWNPSGGAQNVLLRAPLSGTGQIVLEKSAALELAAAVAAGQRIKFHSAAGGNATLTLDKAGAFGGTIQGFVTTDKVMLPGASVTDFAYAATGAHAGALTLSDHGTQVATLAFEGDYAKSDFTVSAAGDSTAITVATAQPAARFAITDTTLGLSTADTGDGYSGPVSYLQNQFIWPSLDKMAIASGQSNVFLHGGAGDDAILVSGGTNVLDGGAGSNFLVGASGADGGTDTFFIDGRGAGVSWGTVVNFHHGDAVTIFGFKDGTSTKPWTAVDGVGGFQGATIHSELAGAGTGVNASVTFAGVSLDDAQSKFSILTGTVGTVPYLYIAYTG